MRKQAKAGYSIQSEDSKEVLSDTPEKELLYRAALSESLLKNYYNYTNQEIALLRKYEGQPLENYPEARSLLGTLTAKFTRISGSCSGKRIGAIYSWEWTRLPGVRKSDIVAVTWKGVYQKGVSNEIRFDDSRSRAAVSYKVSDTSGNVRTFSKSYTSFASNDYYLGAGVKFNMRLRKTSNSYIYTAFKGKMYIYGDVVNTRYPLIEASLHAEYGHATSLSSISVSFPLGLGISFSGPTSILGSKNLIIKTKGKQIMPSGFFLDILTITGGILLPLVWLKVLDVSFSKKKFL